MTPRTSLRSLLLAGVPGIAVTTADFPLLLFKLRKAARINSSRIARRSAVALWSLSTGVRSLSVDDEYSPVYVPPGAINAHRTLEGVLAWLRKQKNTVLLLRGLPELNSRTPVNAIYEMADTIEGLRVINSTIVFPLYGQALPDELRGVVYRYKLPALTKKELTGIALRHVSTTPPTPSIARLPSRSAACNTVGALTAEHPSRLEEAAVAALGLSFTDVENAFAVSVTTTGFVNPEPVRAYRNQVLKRSAVVEMLDAPESINDIGGFKYYKKWLKARRNAYSSAAEEFGVPAPKGVMFVGPSGTGKSLAAKVTANYLGVPLLRFDIAGIYTKWLGDSEAQMREALTTLEALAPAVCWIDEVEKSFAGWSSDSTGVSQRILSQFLYWRQETRAKIFLFCTCNDINRLPVEFMRPGRLDSVFSSNLPLKKERRAIFRIHLQRRGRLEGISSDALELFADASKGLSGADIEATVVDAIICAFNTSKKQMTKKIVMRALTQRAAEKSHPQYS